MLGVVELFTQTLGGDFLDQNKEKSSYEHTVYPKTLSFQVYTPFGFCI